MACVARWVMRTEKGWFGEVCGTAPGRVNKSGALGSLRVPGNQRNDACRAQKLFRLSDSHINDKRLKNVINGRITVKHPTFK